MRILITKETYSGLNGELYKLTGKDVIVAPHLKYPKEGNQIWTRVKKNFWKHYQKQSWTRVWKYEK